MKIISQPAEGLFLFEPTVFADERGVFFESFNARLLQKNGIHEHFVQDNHSVSKNRVIRGLHFQKPPHAQGKLVRVVKGSALDVVVDIRLQSKTYGSHFKFLLSEVNKSILYIPPGFAHGFASLEDDTVFLYKCTAYYHRDSEDGLLWNDPDLGIDWTVTDPLLSAKDLVYKPFSEFKSPF